MSTNTYSFYILSSFFEKFSKDYTTSVYSLSKDTVINRHEVFQIFHGDPLYLAKFQPNRTQFDMSILPSKSYFPVVHHTESVSHEHDNLLSNDQSYNVLQFEDEEQLHFVEFKEPFYSMKVRDFMIPMQYCDKVGKHCSNFLQFKHLSFSALNNTYRYDTSFSKERLVFSIPSAGRRLYDSEIEFFKKTIDDYFKCFLQRKRSFVDVNVSNNIIEKRLPIFLNKTIYFYSFVVTFKDSYLKNAKTNYLTENDILDFLPSRFYEELPTNPKCYVFDNKNEHFHHKHLIVKDEHNKPFYAFVFSMEDDMIVDVTENNSPIDNKRFVGESILF